MSSAKGSGVGRTRRQAHQNAHAFKHNKNSKKTDSILSTANTGGLCLRCAEKIEWRLKFRKYKPLSQPRKCNSCHQKVVCAAYRTLCDECSRRWKVCSQCGKGGSAVSRTIPTKAAENQEQICLENVVQSMRERDRRTVFRKVDRGEAVLASLVGEEDSISSDRNSEHASDEDSDEDEVE